MRSSPIHTVAPGVFATEDPIVRVTSDVLVHLKEAARRSPRLRARLNTHRTMEDGVHEMLIVLDRETYLRPHRHFGKCESFHVIEGQADVVIFDDEGRVTDTIHMGPPATRLCFFYRIAEPRYHTMVIHSPMFVIHETTNGPFAEDRTGFAPWAPAEGTPESALFMRELRAQLAARKH